MNTTDIAIPFPLAVVTTSTPHTPSRFPLAVVTTSTPHTPVMFPPGHGYHKHTSYSVTVSPWPWLPQAHLIPRHYSPWPWLPQSHLIPRHVSPWLWLPQAHLVPVTVST